MANALAITLHAVGQETAAGSALGVDIGTLRTVAKMQLTVLSPLVGTDPELNVIVETSSNNAAPWTERSTTTVKALPSDPIVLTVGGLQRYVRVRWVLRGAGAELTWGLAGVAHVVYCEPRHITDYAVPDFSIKEISEETRVDACIAATADADDSLSGSFTLPLRSWGESHAEKTALLAAAKLFRRRGKDPQSAANASVYEAELNVRKRYFQRISDGKLKPPDIVDSTPERFEGASVVRSRPSRGW